MSLQRIVELFRGLELRRVFSLEQDRHPQTGSHLDDPWVIVNSGVVEVHHDHLALRLLISAQPREQLEQKMLEESTVPSPLDDLGSDDLVSAHGHRQGEAILRLHIRRLDPMELAKLLGGGKLRDFVAHVTVAAAWRL